MKLQKYVLGVLVFIILSLSLRQVFALDKTSTGFYYPTGTSNLGNYAGWLASGCDGDTAYFEGYYHLGFDIAATEGDAVYPIAYGEITHKSFSGWGSGNIGIVVKHRLFDGTEFFALYGHVISDVDIGDEVISGKSFANIGPWPYGVHLHFGIHCGPSIPPSNWGRMLCLNWPDTNGFVDSIQWIENQIPEIDLTLGLIAHYPFNSNVQDQSGNENHGMVYGATLTTDMFGNPDSAYSFDGIDDYIISTSSIDISGNSPRSILAWVNLDNFYEMRGILGWGVAEDQYGDIQKRLCFLRVYDTGQFLFHGHYQDLYTAEDVISTSHWYHVVFTYDGTTGNLYVNGNLEGSGLLELNTTGNPLKIGFDTTRSHYFWDRHWEGKIDDVRIYNRALSQTEIQQLFWQTLGITHGEETIHEEEMTIQQYEIIDIPIEIPDHCAQSTISRIIQGSDVEMSLILPDGITIINRDTQDQNVYHVLGSTYEAYQITNPIPGQWTVRLEGTDVPKTGEAVSLTVSVNTVPNQPPIADAGPNQTVEVGFNCMANIILDGSVSFDPDEDELTYFWIRGESSATGINPEIQLPLGVHTITLIVNDGTMDSNSDTVDIIVIDQTPPEITVTATPNILWPPNHKMIEINLTVEASDNCDEYPDIVLTFVISNKPDNGKHDGNTINDIQNADVGTEDYNILLRAERSGKGDGRIYTITYTVIDASGNDSMASATVTVPHNKESRCKRTGIKK